LQDTFHLKYRNATKKQTQKGEDRNKKPGYKSSAGPELLPKISSERPAGGARPEARSGARGGGAKPGYLSKTDGGRKTAGVFPNSADMANGGDMRFSRVWVIFTFVFALAGFAQNSPKKVTQQEAVKAAISKVQPEYPPIARQLKVSGTVELEAVVDETGKVEQVKIISGNPILTAPASAALKRWKFTPFTEDGKPVKAVTSFNFNFRLEN
jgi:TonB family protein